MSKRAGGGGKKVSTTCSSHGYNDARKVDEVGEYFPMALYARSLNRSSTASDAEARTTSDRSRSKIRYALSTAVVAKIKRTQTSVNRSRTRFPSEKQLQTTVYTGQLYVHPSATA